MLDRLLAITAGDHNITKRRMQSVARVCYATYSLPTHGSSSLHRPGRGDGAASSSRPSKKRRGGRGT